MFRLLKSQQRSWKKKKMWTLTPFSNQMIVFVIVVFSSFSLVLKEVRGPLLILLLACRRQSRLRGFSHQGVLGFVGGFGISFGQKALTHILIIFCFTESWSAAPLPSWQLLSVITARRFQLTQITSNIFLFRKQVA